VSVAVATNRADVAVLGGGVAGLAAALASARSGRRVVLIERDGPPGGGDADGLFEHWDRRGIAHFRQPHNFLGLGRQVLLEHAPDVLEAVLALGGTEHRQYELVPGEAQAGDEAFVSICARRPVFEAALRRAVDAEPQIEVRANTGVVDLTGANRRQNGAVRITGARTDDGAEVAAELVVDALGRTSKLLLWLGDLGARPPLERRSACCLLYYSRHFRFRPGVEIPKLPALLRGPRAEIGYMAYAVFVEDNRTFCPVLTIPPWDRESCACSSPKRDTWRPRSRCPRSCPGCTRINPSRSHPCCRWGASKTSTVRW
jgi:glycine/D-amino acid oxidase-like deaminating enzyme